MHSTIQCIQSIGGWKSILSRIIDVNDGEAIYISLTEYIQEKSLNPIEEACAFEAHHLKSGITELALKIGKSIGPVDRRMGLLELPSDVTDLIASWKLSSSVRERK